jgi:hypothetical protein
MEQKKFDFSPLREVFEDVIFIEDMIKVLRRIRVEYLELWIGRTISEDGENPDINVLNNSFNLEILAEAFSKISESAKSDETVKSAFGKLTADDRHRIQEAI